MTTAAGAPGGADEKPKSRRPDGPRDFFGRPLPPKPAATAAPAATVSSPSKVPPGLRYKFHEGITNAVRRPVYIKDLL